MGNSQNKINLNFREQVDYCPEVHPNAYGYNHSNQQQQQYQQVSPFNNPIPSMLTNNGITQNLSGPNSRAASYTNLFAAGNNSRAGHFPTSNMPKPQEPNYGPPSPKMYMGDLFNQPPPPPAEGYSLNNYSQQPQQHPPQ